MVAASNCIRRLAAYLYLCMLRSRREMYTAMREGKAVISIWEADEGKGGSTLEALMQEIREHCSPELDENPGHTRNDEVARRIIEAEDAPIRWVRLAAASLGARRIHASSRLLWARAPALPHHHRSARSTPQGLSPFAVVRCACACSRTSR